MAHLIRVSAESNHYFLAERIAEALHNDDNLVLQAIGVKAVYQAVKASATAHNNLQPERSFCLLAEFVDVDIEGDIRTAIRFILRMHPNDAV
ncbi:MAG: stage V sporulation protein S [Caldilineaceae bacterium]|nr:stage V sporulation protein S [Caldilineaceae bacterium]